MFTCMHYIFCELGYCIVPWYGGNPCGTAEVWKPRLLMAFSAAALLSLIFLLVIHMGFRLGHCAVKSSSNFTHKISYILSYTFI